MNLSRSFLAGALGAFVLLTLSAELFCRWAAGGFWYSRFDLSGDMTSLPEIRDRLSDLPPGPRSVLLLGDSVLGASSLLEHRIPKGRSQTLTRQLQARGAAAGWSFMSLGSDGLLMPDIEGLTAEIERKPPQNILLLLNFRMFSKDYAQGKDALSRKFLTPDLPRDLQDTLSQGITLTPEQRLDDRAYAWLCRVSALFRDTQMLKVLWYYPSQKDFFQRMLEALLGVPEGQEDMQEAALEQKVAPYYQSYLWDPQGIPFTCLRQCLDQWKHAGIRVTAVLTPQNASFLGPSLDKPSFKKNRRTLAAFFKQQAGPLVSYRDWAERYPSSCFLDHCHLTPQGNARYAQDLLQLLNGGTP